MTSTTFRVWGCAARVIAAGAMMAATTTAGTVVQVGTFSLTVVGTNYVIKVDRTGYSNQPDITGAFVDASWRTCGGLITESGIIWTPGTVAVGSFKHRQDNNSYISTCYYSMTLKSDITIPAALSWSPNTSCDPSGDRSTEIWVNIGGSVTFEDLEVKPGSSYTPSGTLMGLSPGWVYRFNQGSVSTGTSVLDNSGIAPSIPGVYPMYAEVTLTIDGTTGTLVLGDAYDLHVIPEPSALCLAASGGALLVGRSIARHRRPKRQT